MRVMITGGHGLVGTRFVTAYKDRHEFIFPGEADGKRVDITDRDALEAAVTAAGPIDAFVHLAAYTDVNGAFAQTDDKNGVAWQVNVVGTRNVAQVCAARHIYLIHVSTAFVFDGEKTGAYTESDVPHPIEWYGLTKYEAEKEVTASDSKSVILRIDQPFSHERSQKVDTLWRVIEGLRARSLYPQFDNHFFGPTYIEDLSRVFDWCLRQQPTGLYHASSGEQWSDFEFAQTINEILHLGADVQAGNLNDYLKTAKRPYQRNTVLDISKLTQELDFKLCSVREAISKVQLSRKQK